jgi:hypothetical protein
VLPSLTFEQCCAVEASRPMLEVVAEHFVQRGDAAACARALAAQAAQAAQAQAALVH